MKFRLWFYKWFPLVAAVLVLAIYGWFAYDILSAHHAYQQAVLARFG